MRKLEITLSDKNYQDALALHKECRMPGGHDCCSLESWCSQVIEAHLASHRLEHLPKLSLEDQLRRDAQIGWRGGQEQTGRRSRGVARLQPR